MLLPRGLAVLLFLTVLSNATGARADALRRVDQTVEQPPRRASAASRDAERSSRGGRSWGGGRALHEQPERGHYRDPAYEGMWSAGELEENDDSTDLFLLYVVFNGLASPWTIPRVFDDPRLVRYAAYPYADGPGLLRADPDEADASTSNSKVALQMDVESGYLLQGVVPGSFAMRLMLPARFELSSRVSLLSDVLETPAEVAVASTSHVVYRHAQSKRAEFRTGLGARMFSLDTLRWGFDFLYAVDAYLSRWSVLRAEIHLGTLDSAFTVQARATMGVMIKRVELYAGYDHTGFHGNGTTQLGGPVAGIRAWF